MYKNSYIYGLLIYEIIERIIYRTFHKQEK